MTYPTLRRGDRGADVITAQVRLTALGYPLSCDGEFGLGTKNAVMAFQRARGLSADGVVGPMTWMALAPPDGSLTARLPDWLQGQSPWGSQRYGSGTYGSSACGPTSMAMAASALLGRGLTPPEAGAWSVAHGYRIDGQGTSWSYFAAYSKVLNLSCEELLVSRIESRGKKPSGAAAKVQAALASGKQLVVARMGPGLWTKSGHYILLYGVDGADALIRDPATRTKPERLRAELARLDIEAGPYFILGK